MLVVAPASDISRLDWLTNAEDDARTEAGERADELAEATPTDDVEFRVGDSDPVKAIEDALRTFPADELIVVTLPDEDAAWLEKGSAEAALKRFSSQSHASSSKTNEAAEEPDRSRLPREASPAKEANNGQHNEDDDDDPKPGHVILSVGSRPTLRRMDGRRRGRTLGRLALPRLLAGPG
jgi:hypothetical protein